MSDSILTHESARSYVIAHFAKYTLKPSLHIRKVEDSSLVFQAGDPGLPTVDVHFTLNHHDGQTTGIFTVWAEHDRIGRDCLYGEW